MIPLWLQYVQAVAVVTIAAIGARLAWKQVQIADVKLQHDLYDRRYRVFYAARTLLANIGLKGSASDDDVHAFMRDTSDAVFLFDDELPKYLEEMGKRAFRHAGPVNGDVMIEYMWFGEQLSTLVSKFEPFLKLDKRQRGVAWRLRWRRSRRDKEIR